MTDMRGFQRHALSTGLIVLAVVGSARGAANAGIVASSSFATDLDGWTSNTHAEISYQSTGGNPGGYIQFTDNTAASTNVFAPSKFLGNYLANGVSSLSFDFNIFAETHIQTLFPYEADLSGPGGSATFLGPMPASVYPTGWVTVTAQISNTATPPAGWTVNSGTWLGLLANVTQVQIPIELITNVTIPGDTDIEGIDNVILTSTGIPEPASLATLGFGLLGLKLLRRLKRAGSRPI